jgi:hypothetical protein
LAARVPREKARDQTSTEEVLAALGRLAGEDRRRLKNGGPGYGDGSWQDLQDREEAAKSEGKGAAAEAEVGEGE